MTIPRRIGLRIASLLLAAWSTQCASPESIRTTNRAARGKGFSVLLISIDTLRADRLGCYGYPRGTSPNLDTLAMESVRFAQAIAPAPWTTPSHMTLMTSLHPSSHGVNRSFDELSAAPDGRGRFRVLSPSDVTMAEVLRENGYATFAITGGGTMAAELGFGQGFDEFTIVSKGQPMARAWTQLQASLDRAGSRPFFLFFHTFEVHAPYSHEEVGTMFLHEEQRARMMETIEASDTPTDAQRSFLASQGLLNREVTSALYDGGIRFVDTFLGRLFENLRERGLHENTIIVVLSDHGEAFGEHDAERFFDAHCDTQYEELTRVPLLVRHPPLRGRSSVVQRQVGLIDVFPTILDLLELEAPPQLQGRSLEALLAGDSGQPSWIVSEATCFGPSVKAWRGDRFKYIATFELGENGERSFIPGRLLSEELFDLREDPGETTDLSGLRSDLTGRSRAKLRRHFETLAKRARAEKRIWIAPDPALAKELRALGYL